jgi:hypothetical protein
MMYVIDTIAVYTIIKPSSWQRNPGGGLMALKVERGLASLADADDNDVMYRSW